MIPRVTDELGTVSTLDDRPNDTGGLTAAELKAKFDADAGTLKEYVNDVLIPFLEGASAAASLGITTIPGFSADNIQTALEQIVQAMQDVTQGSVADGSITLAKLAAEVTAIALGGAAASHTHGAGDINSGVLDAARIPVLDGTKLGTGSVGTEQLGAAVVTADNLAALAVLATHIAAGAVTTQKIAAKAVTAANVADGTLTREKMAADVLGIASETRSMMTPFAEECNGQLLIVSPDANQNFTLTAEILSALPTGWAVTIVRGSISGGATYTIGWDADIPVINGNDRKMTWSGAGSISLNRTGDMVTIAKWANLQRIIVMGNTNVRNIYVGTSDSPPSYWAAGDIYLKYE